MTITCKIKLCFVNILLTTSSPLIANTYKVISYDPANPPHNISTVGQQGKATISGIFADIFHQIGEVTGDTFIMVIIPAARAMLEFDLARVYIEPGINSTSRSNSKNRFVFHCL
ncbi:MULTISPECIES: hypothetical protein [unclassified Colwellia]|uniref:hypothetical protein n=1 Tax=unclassified Colwellia TaxID=196834 RepID=UPI0015F7046A|nr:MULTISPECIES: hypothetical protein [unclassified Colwellia]MBA6231119.1 hypothetical protein [Colwellia sp. MB02u-7]MBA6235113.1 hypothetical protein [Colwellia sp. MB02u-11]MBA6257500.1 hypothetical protein [Colwellia sp. MB3u-28]MBA6260572.1 hypothetical protein [Colwellia sp. MB3u-41]MBA6301678.1 hypothetical protein [Colwellia sp. MB3u-22]